MTKYYNEDEVIDQSAVGRLVNVYTNMLGALEDLSNKETHILDIPYEKMFDIIRVWAHELAVISIDMMQAKLDENVDRVVYNPIVKREEEE